MEEWELLAAVTAAGGAAARLRLLRFVQPEG
jgi:hypothetical protein